MHVGSSANNNTAGSVFVDRYEDYLGLAPSTIVSHERYKHVERLGIAQRWARKHHCDPPQVELHCSPWQYVGCGGARWNRCVVRSRPYDAAGCSNEVTLQL